MAAGLSLILAGILWLGWLWQVCLQARRCSRFADRWLLLAVPALCAALLWGVLRNLAADDVREAPVYLYLYMVLGAAWLAVAVRFLPLFGLSARDDVVERGNRAAALALSGALLGITLCYAGGNIGNGPGWWVVVFCAALATGALFALWFSLDQVTGLADAVTIDRDPAAGVRAAAFFLGTGLILGRAVAGDWESATATVSDFGAAGWPALVLFLLAVYVERHLRPTAERPNLPLVTHGWLPAAAYLGLAAAAVARQGSWG
jgi:uncharacterized membrane protein YjfL (UPF0719 family)